jgi:hypothetical protein
VSDDASDGDAAPPGRWPPPTGAWEAAEARAFVDLVVGRREHQGPREGWAAHPWAGEAIDRFAARRALEATVAGRVLPRWACPPLDPDAISDRVRTAIQHNQKPFHLWNVERVEHEDPFDFEVRDGLRLGRAATLPDELRPPRSIEKATRALRAWLEDQDFRRTLDRHDAQRRRRLWVDALPYGRKDDEVGPAGGDDGDYVVIAPPGPGGRGVRLDERLAPFIRLPVPGPLPPRGAAEDEGAEDGDGGAFGGLDLSQPADEDEDDGRAGGGFAGFELSQQDDEDD